MHAAIMLRNFVLPNKLQEGCTRLAAVRLIAEFADMFPLVSDCPHICCLHSQPFEVECVRQIITKQNAVRLKKNPSATHGEGAHDYTPITELWLLYAENNVVSTASSPGSSTIGSTASAGDSSMSVGEA